MSEHQMVAFRAIDAPVSKQNLAYMRKQSSRARITSRSFDNEYHYGDFRGNVKEMLRRGYDMHLHYANFGIRSLYIRLPRGLPDPKAAKAYFDRHSISFAKDREGPGGVLSVEPCYEPGHLDELWDIDKVLNRLLPLRQEIMDGDLRPLYLARLAVAIDSEHDPEEEVEPPVPAGLREPTKAQQALAKFWGIGKSMFAAAADESPGLRGKQSAETNYMAWLRKQPSTTKDAWLAELLEGSKPALRSELLAKYRVDGPHAGWPVAKGGRSIAELLAAADKFRKAAKEKAAAEAARKRAAKLAEMAANPQPYLKQTEKLVASRSVDTYEKVADLLADLREALAGTKKAGLAETQAQKLKQKNPKLHHLTGALRRKGFVPKM